jgi:YD repeat-containing protein
VAKQVDWLGKTTASLLFDKALPKRAEADASRDVFEPNPNAGGEKKPPHTTGLPEPGMRELEGHHGVACQASSGLCPPSAASRTDFREPRPDGVRVPGRGEDPPEKPQVSVGGVYLDPVAQTALRLSSLKGVSIDAATGRLTLIGEGVETSAVPVDLDDLAVAIAAAASRTSWPGVTIDPPPGNPESPIAYYKYFGPMTENTHFGGVLALADRWMKSISVGFDNEHPETIVRPNAPDFKDSFQLGAEFASPQANGWSRFWIVPASVKWETSADGLALWCSEARMAVNTQTMVVQNGRLVDSPGVHRASDEAFAAWFTNHYDDLARQYPVYAELRELAKLVSLAAVLKDRLPHDEFLRISQTLIPTRSATPTQTPTVRTTKTLGDMQVTILGGVDLEPDKAAFSSPGPKGEALKAAVALTTPAISVPTISEVEIGARKYEAVSIPPVSLYHPGALILDEADFDSVGWGLVARRYDSGVATVGPYGPGWRMERPRIALPDENSGKQPQIPASTLAMLNLDKQPVFNLMEIGNDKIRLRTVEGGDFLVGRDGRLLHGESDQLKIDYQEEGGRLESIVHRPSRGEPWRTAFKYEGDQLTTVTDDRLGTINYQYDPEGRLAEMRSAHRLVRYRYDEHGRLSQRLENGRVENYQIAADGEALAVSDADGVKISFRSTLDSSGRLKREIADFAAPQSLRFDERGDIAAVEGRGWTLETARAGNVEGSTLHLGTTTEWSRQVDPIARRIVEQVRDDRTLTSKLRADGGPESTVVSAANGGEQVDVHYDIDGEWLSISDSDGTGLQRSRDAQGRVEEISAPQGDYRFSFDSAMNSVEVEGPENLRIRMALDRDGKAREIEESDDHGPRAWSRANPSTWEFRAAGQLLRTIEEGEIGRVVGSRYGGLEVRAEHSLGGSLIVTPDGRQTLGRIDRDGRPLEIEEYPTGTPKLALPCLDVTGEKVVDQSPEEDQRPDKPQ